MTTILPRAARATMLVGMCLALAAAAPATPGASTTPTASAPGWTVRRDLAYGRDDDQRADAYVPDGARSAPVIVMVHGGGWRRGDKEMGRVVEQKVARWAPMGAILVSVNYRMLPEADPIEQARDVARALAYVQAHARDWGGDPARVTLMGHSAGAHLVALLAADPTLATHEGARPWLGTVSLDNAALDVVGTMQGRHLPLYDDAFGRDADYWHRASPLHRMTRAPAPLFLVCSSRRASPCAQARAFAARARSFGGRATVHPEPLSHMEINAKLGEPGAYTAALESWLRAVGGL